MGIRRLGRNTKRKLDEFIRTRQPNEKIFSDIYKKNRWPSNENGIKNFTSGDGSEETFAIPYANLINNFISKNNVKSVVDLGCGDLRVFSKIFTHHKHVKYTGIDVVPELIETLSQYYPRYSQINFLCLDIVEDNVPYADLYLIRQVLQHLSNKAIKLILNKLPFNAFIIITEQQYINDNGIIPNKNIVNGHETRLIKGSATYLDQEPFNLNILLLQQVDVDEITCLRTFLLKKNINNFCCENVLFI